MHTDPVATAQAIMKTFRVLPTVPAAASKAIQLLNEPDVDMGSVADILLADQVMAARIIRIVNSPLYKLLQEIDSIRKALIYLGPQRVFEIILTSCFLELTDTTGNGPLKMLHCWEHAFGVGLIAREIAKMSGYAIEEQAYLAGILHDIGEVILSQQRKDEFMRVLVIARSKNIDLWDAEIEVFGTSHAEVGGLLAEQWHFPEEFIDVIKHHHTADTDTMSPLTHLIYIADLICTRVGFCCKYDSVEQRSGKVFEHNLLDVEKQLATIGIKDINEFRRVLLEMIPQVKQTVETIYN